MKMQEEFGLHELAIEDAKHAHQRPKIEPYGDVLLIVLKTAQWNGQSIEYGETHVFMGKSFFVSIRHGASASYAVVRERCEAMPHMLLKGSGFALYGLLDFVVDNYQQIVSELEVVFDQLEVDIFKGEFDRSALTRAYALKRQLIQLKNAVLPIDDICNELMRFHEDMISKELKIYFRDVQDHSRRVISAIESIREMLTSAMQVHLALVGVGQNDIVRRLAGWGAILALPTVVFSMYGMNFSNMPELKWEWAYPVTLLVTFLGCYLLYRKLAKEGWV
jgi:magnesium transporter